MNKANQFRSQNFHMDIGDILHLRFIDETGATAEINLTSEVIQSKGLPPQTPIADDATDITSSGFTANWSLMQDATGYYLDVAEDVDFTVFVDGYNNKSMGTSLSEAVVSTDPSAPIKDSTSYYYRVRCINASGLSDNSNVISVVTLAESVLDGDGNSYTYVTVGTQQWTKENLKTTKYIDGSVIPNLTVNGDWISDTIGAYCWYNNDIANKVPYGALYNWYAVNNAHGIAPMGWRVPSDADFSTLITFLGGGSVAGGKLKESGLAHWLTPNTGATDEYGFSALGCGYRDWISGIIGGINSGEWLWSTDETGSNGHWILLLYNSMEASSGNGSKIYGKSIRFVRDI